VKSCATFIAEAKAALGDARMSDRELGERLVGYAQQEISRAKHGYMSDTIAIAVAKAIGIAPGAVLQVARAERENNPDVRTFLLEWARETFAVAPLSPRVPDVVVRGGVKELRYSATQRWRKRSVSSRRPGGLSVSARLFEVPAS